MINFKSKNRSDCSCFFVVHIKRTANGYCNLEERL